MRGFNLIYAPAWGRKEEKMKVNHGKIIGGFFAGKVPKTAFPLSVPRKKILAENHVPYYGTLNNKAIKLAAIGDKAGAYQAIRDGEQYGRVAARHPGLNNASFEEYLARYDEQIEPLNGADILMNDSFIKYYLLAQEIRMVNKFF